jgi:AcrR family transcriptional regulator
MAKKQEPPKTAKADLRRRMIEAALTLAARQGWRGTGLSAIAAEAGLPLHEAYALFRSKAAILDGFLRQVDEAVLAGAGGADDEPARDRLFDTLMRRFDALQPHKPAVRMLLRDGIGDPQTLLALPGLMRSMTWMLEASGISAAGWRGKLRVQILAALYLSVLRVFLDDDSADLTKTMATLDRRLRRGEALLGLAPRREGTAAAD